MLRFQLIISRKCPSLRIAINWFCRCTIFLRLWIFLQLYIFFAAMNLNCSCTFFLLFLRTISQLWNEIPVLGFFAVVKSNCSCTIFLQLYKIFVRSYITEPKRVVVNLFSKLKMQPEHCWANFKFANPSVSWLLHKLEVYVNSVSCWHQHLLWVVGQTAHRVFHNLRSGYHITIMTITQQTACSLSYNKWLCYSTTMIIVTVYTCSLCVS